MVFSKQLSRSKGAIGEHVRSTKGAAKELHWSKLGAPLEHLCSTLEVPKKLHISFLLFCSNNFLQPEKSSKGAAKEQTKSSF